MTRRPPTSGVTFLLPKTRIEELRVAGFCKLANRSGCHGPDRKIEEASRRRGRGKVAHWHGTHSSTPTDTARRSVRVGTSGRCSRSSRWEASITVGSPWKRPTQASSSSPRNGCSPTGRRPGTCRTSSQPAPRLDDRPPLQARCDPLHGCGARCTVLRRRSVARRAARIRRKLYRVQRPALTGRLVYPLTDAFFVQWPTSSHWRAGHLRRECRLTLPTSGPRSRKRA